MQFEYFIIPAGSPGEATEDLNRFLRSHRILSVRQEFVADTANPRWCVAVEYLDGKGRSKSSRDRRPKRIDYKDVLSPEDFALFAKLRDWRKDTAEQEGVPVYTIFTNEQLAKMAGDRITTKSGLSELDGVGEGRVGKYGEAIIKIIKEKSSGANGQTG